MSKDGRVARSVIAIVRVRWKAPSAIFKLASVNVSQVSLVNAAISANPSIMDLVQTAAQLVIATKQAPHRANVIKWVCASVAQAYMVNSVTSVYPVTMGSVKKAVSHATVTSLVQKWLNAIITAYVYARRALLATSATAVRKTTSTFQPDAKNVTIVTIWSKWSSISIVTSWTG